MSTPTNHAAWMPAPKVIPLAISPAPYTAPGPNQIVIRNHALGINPIDWVKQLLGDALLAHVQYPAVLGEDIAGTVVAVGEGVTRFKEGDRVLAVAAALLSNSPAEGGFQEYTVVREWFAVGLPESVTFEAGAALPLAVLTAGTGLFGKEGLALDLPSIPRRESNGRVVIVAGGASAVGGTAVQLVRAAGYDVVSTASPHNFELVKKLGAEQVFDYKSEDLAAQLGAAVRGRQLCGCFSLGDGTADIFAEVILKHEGPGETSKRITRVEGKHTVSEDSGIEMSFVVNGIARDNATRPLFEEFLPKALAEGVFVPHPEPVIVGKGLDKIQDAFAKHREGVSAKKVVVQL